MSFRIVRASILAEKTSEFHEARILLLLDHITKRKPDGIDGITKLAKLDFLLRYPVFLQRVLDKTKKKPSVVDIKEYELHTVESKMIRFRYGPWDHRYRSWIGLLVAKGLANTFLKGRTVFVTITDKGKELAEQFRTLPEFDDTNTRSSIISQFVGSMSGSKLKRLVYEVVPELSNMSWGDHIEHEPKI
jgi:hypothetical protein